MAGRLLGDALTITGDGAFRAAHESREEIRRHCERSFREGAEHVVFGDRRTGKTTLALGWLSSAPTGVERVLVVKSHDLAVHQKREAGLPRRSPALISLAQLLREGARPGVEYGFDGIVEMLTDLLRLKAAPALLTVEVAPDWQVEPRTEKADEVAPDRPGS